MGRGLSELQKTILAMAYKNHEKESRVHPKHELRIWSLEDDSAKDKAFFENIQTIRDEAPSGLERLFDARQFDRRGYLMVQLTDRYEDLIPSISFLTGKNIPFSVGQQLQFNGCGTCPYSMGCYVCNRSDLYTYEVIWEYYGINGGGSLPLSYHGDRAQHAFLTYWSRNKHRFDEKKFNAAKVSVTKAFKRLEDRHLAYRMAAGINLTLEGIEEASNILVRNG